MSVKKLNLWTTPIHVIDGFIDNKDLYDNLLIESSIEQTIEGQNEHNLTQSQQLLFKQVEAAAINYCLENDIDYENLIINDIQKGCLKKYDHTMVGNHLYEPHHDIGEKGFITAIYYIDSDYSEEKWVGGELAIYKQLTFADYPDNCINILPKQNRLIIFPGYNVHRVKPYFGDKPRTSMVLGWAVKDGETKDPLVI